jgi:hypothetical protein
MKGERCFFERQTQREDGLTPRSWSLKNCRCAYDPRQNVNIRIMVINKNAHLAQKNPNGPTRRRR